MKLRHDSPIPEPGAAHQDLCDGRQERCFVTPALQQRLESAGQRRAELKGQIADIDRNLTQFTAQRHKLLDLYLTDSVAKDMLAEKMAEIAVRIRQFTTERATLQALLDRPELADHDPNVFIEFLTRVRGNSETMTFVERRELIERLRLTGTVYRGGKTSETRIDPFVTFYPLAV